ncbi:MAG: PAS domain S-box protein [Candidatus Cloacimonetes bacterium]|nr:PAS domain S-box protein [Candidatus Cloacimonadota bacterium]
MKYKILFYFFMSLIILAADSTDIRRLNRSLEKATDKERVILLIDLSLIYLDSQPEQSITESRKALYLAENLAMKKEQIQIYENIARAYENLQNNEEAWENYKRSLELALQNNEMEAAAEVYIRMGFLAEDNNAYDDALFYYQSALKLYQRLDLRKDISDSYNYIGIIYESQNEYGKALECYLKSLEINEQIESKEGISISLNNIGNIYLSLNDASRALDYYIQSYEIELSLDNDDGLSSSYINLGNAYSSLGRIEEALHYYQEALNLDTENNDLEGIASSLNNIAILNYDQKDYQLSQKNYEQSLLISEQINDIWGIANTSNNLAELFLEIGKYKEAYYYMNQGLKNARIIGAKEIVIESNKLLSRYYYLNAQYRTAYDYFKKYVDLNDSLFAENIYKINSLHTQFETEKKENKIALLLEEKKHNTLVRNFLIFTIVFVLLVILLLYYLYQSKRKEIVIRKQVENKLIESESKFRTLAEKIKTAIYIFNHTGSFIYVNPIVEKITGYSKEELLQMKFYELVHPDFREMVKERGFKRIHGENPIESYEFKIINKQGNDIWIEISNGSIKLGEETVVLGTAIDITERRNAEQKLIASEKRYRTLQANVPIGIFRISPEGAILSANEYMARLFKFNSVEQMLNISVFKLFINNADWESLNEKLQEEGVLKDYEIQMQKRDSSRFWGSLNTRMILDNKGKWIYQDGIIEDISQRKKAQEVQSFIYNISTAINRSFDLTALYRYIHLELGKVVDNTNFYITLYDKDTNVISAPYYVDQFKKTTPQPQQLKTGITAYVIRTGKSLFLTVNKRNELIRKGLIADYAWKSKIWLGVPLRMEKEIIGAMAIQSYVNEKAFSRDDLRIMEIISDQVALAITKRRADDALKDSERFNRAIIDSSPLGISSRDRNGTLIIANRAWKEIWGKTDSELQDDKKRREKLEFNERDDYLGYYREQVKKIYEKGGSLYIPELKLLGRKTSGKNKWISQYFYAIMDKSDKVDRVVIITEDITERKINEMKIESSLREKDVMLKEIYHRVKNNMQVISSLLKLQSQHISDEKSLGLFQDSQNRVKSMSLIHEKLYLSDNLERIDFDNYVSSLTTHLFSSYSISPYDVNLSIDMQNVYLDINKAIPLGLMINELVSNALKHGFKDHKIGNIIIKLSFDGKTYRLIVFNDGQTFPENVNFRKARTLGLQLVNALTDQLHGKIRLYRKKGTEFIITFEQEPEES